jgi:hypothetical protein
MLILLNQSCKKLLYSNDEIVFGKEANDSYWIIANNYIKHKSTNLFLSVINKNLTLTKAKQKWNIIRFAN